MKSTIQRWTQRYAEITEELAQFRAMAAALQAQFDDEKLAAAEAEIACRESRAMFSPIQVVVWPHGHTARLAGLIELYLAADENDRDAARNRAARAGADLEVARHEITKRELALRQLDTALAAAVSSEDAQQEAA